MCCVVLHANTGVLLSPSKPPELPEIRNRMMQVAQAEELHLEQSELDKLILMNGNDGMLLTYFSLYSVYIRCIFSLYSVCEGETLN